MTRNRIVLTGIALVSAIFAIATHVHAARPTPESPPAEWAQYIAEVRKADAIENDEARCKAYPDLPGNQWRPGAAQGRCTLLRAPAWSLDDIDRLLATPEGLEQLERGFAALLDGHYNDPAQREQIFVTFNVFDASPRAGEIARRWLKQAPKSAFAHTAVGTHLFTAGWDARGGAYVKDTPEDKFKRMYEFFAQAVPEYVEALQIEPRLSVACYKLHSIGRQSSDQLQQYAMSHCMRTDPDSYWVAWEGILAAQPRWGGSDEQLRMAVAYAAARTDRNPMMGALLGEAAGYRPSVADNPGDVVEALAAASRMGPSGTLMSQTGAGYWNSNDPWPAVVYYSQATRFWPDEPRHRYARAAILVDYLYDFAWARSDMLIAVEKEPDNASYNYLLGVATEEVKGTAAARPYYKRAMTGDKRQQAMQRYCETYMIPHIVKEADACTRSLVTDFPQSADAWQARAWVLHAANNPQALEAAERFKALANPRSTDHRRTLDAMKAWTDPRRGTSGKGRAPGK